MKVYNQRAITTFAALTIIFAGAPLRAETTDQPTLEETLVRGSYLQSNEANALKTPTPVSYTHLTLPTIYSV